MLKQAETDRSRDGHSQRGRLLGCVGAPAVLLGAYLAWANTLPPVEPDARSLPSPNGYDAGAAAAAQLGEIRRGSPLERPDRARPAELRPLLAAKRAPLEAVRASLRQEWAIPAAGRLAPGSPLPAFRNTARLFAAESYVELAERRPAAALDRALDALELGAAVGRGGALTEHLVGLACAAIGMRAAEEAVPSLPPGSVRAAGRRLDAILERRPSFTEALRGERKQVLRELRFMFAGGAMPGAGSGRSGETLRRVGWFFYPKPLTYGAVEASLQTLIAESQKPYCLRQPAPPPREPLAALLLPVLSQGGLVHAANETSVRLLRSQVALRQYRERHGRYPERLEGLVPEVLPAVPEDPFTGKPLVYRLEGAGVPVLYSVGPDGADDAGRPIPVNTLKNNSGGDLVAGMLFPRVVLPSGRGAGPSQPSRRERE